MMCFGIWWIVPLACLIMMVGMMVLQGGLGGMRCAPWRRGPGRPASRAGADHDRAGHDIPGSARKD